MYKNKIAIVVTPTILMQDHVKNIKAAQPDLQAEDRVLSFKSEVNVVLEWIANARAIEKLKHLASNEKICLIAIDEAHLFHYWQEFRRAYKDLECLHAEFSNVSLVCLTATAKSCVEQSMFQNPLLSRDSVNRPKIFLACEEIPSHIGRKDI